MGVLDSMAALATPAPAEPVHRVFTDDVVAKLEALRPLKALVTLDFETFYSSDFSLSKQTTSEYVRDERFQVIGVGVKWGNLPAQWMSEAEFRAWAKWVPWHSTAVLAHNAAFDGFILSERFGIRPGFWFDTLSMARAIHGTEVGGSLAKLAVHYGVGEKGHEVVLAKGKRLEDFTPDELAAYGAYCVNDVEITKPIFDAMARHFKDSELWLIDTTLRMFTEPTFRSNQALLEEMLREEIQAKADLLSRVAQDKATLVSNDKFAALLIQMRVEPPRKISAAKSKTAGEPVETWAFSKSDPGFKELLEHPRDEIKWLAEARAGVKTSIGETRAERFIKLGEGGKPMPFFLKYHGAHTGRWAGGDKTNVQNMNRAVKGDPKSGRLRKAIMAPPGWVIIVADSSQIEPRTNAWLSNHGELLDLFRKNDAKTDLYERTGQGEKGDLYSDAGGPILGKKITKEDPDRQFAKVLIIGLGYQLGTLKFQGELLKGMLGTPPRQFFQADVERYQVDVDRFLKRKDGKPDKRKLTRLKKIPSRLDWDAKVIHAAVADEFVKRYRNANAPIVKLWKTAELFLRTIANGEGLDYGPLEIGPWGIRRPSGLCLRYPELKWTPPPPYDEEDDDDAEESFGGFSYWDGRKRKKAYGGSVTENCVQALARDIVAEQMLRVRAYIEPFGGKIATSTHDEIVACVPEKYGEEALAFTLDCMKTSPSWCPELPLWAEGGMGTVYGNVK